ncbi:hypothetical protein [Aliidiomarina maris]|nr:hypothetical protein [Aliidiomarina maris]
MSTTSTPANYPDRPGTNVEVDSGAIAQPAPGQGDYEGVNRPDIEQHELRDNASVAEQLKGLLAEDSPYIKQAELRAAQEAASRGLRNSTMGVQAGQQAAIAQALPIAQQDAQQNFQLQQNEQLQGYQMDQTLYNALLTGERDAVMQQYGLDQAQYNAALQQAQMRNQQGFELDRLEYQTQLQSVLNNEQHQQTLERMDVDQRNQLDTINQQFVNQMEAMGVEMEHQARMAYTQSSTMIMQSAMEQLGFIYSNPEMSPEQQANAVNTVMNQLQQQLNFTSTLFEPFPGLDFAQPSTPQTPNNSGNNSGSSNTLPVGGYTPPSTGGQQQRVVSGGGAISGDRWDNQAQR